MTTAKCGDDVELLPELLRDGPTARRSSTSTPAARADQTHLPRAPAVCLHRAKLARQAAGQSPGDCSVDRQHHSRNRAQGLLRDRDGNLYPKDVKVSDQEMAELNIKDNAFHPERNYTISPNQQPP
jgi:hypothetical protein